ncbi:MAG: hypothetical protein AAB834_06735 [Patescibacteria group bacterium]
MNHINPPGPQLPLSPGPSEPNNPKYEKYEAERQLVQAISGSSEILAKATTVFPFMLFPDDVTIDRTQVTIAHRSFFRIGEVNSIRIEDILNVNANVGPFFGSLQIYTRFFNTKKPLIVNWLWRNDALRIKRILQGYLIAIKKGIDCTALSTKELSADLDELGKNPVTEEV